MPLKYGFVIPTGDPHTVADLAREAEESGWDGAFYWDGINVGEMDTYDPWVVMAAMAMRTERVRIGAMLTPPARRRPWKLARETVTLDHLSRGRLVLPFGLGAVFDGAFGKVGEPTDRKTRAELLDESLAILTGIWSGEPFRFDGKHFHMEEMTFRPTPVQSPRIPIWIVGAWPSEKSMGRALRYDGVIPQPRSGNNTPDELRAAVAYVAEHRPAADPFDIIWEGVTPGDDPETAAAIVRPFAEAGITWWIESRWEAPNDPETLRVRIRQGPPHLE